MGKIKYEVYKEVAWVTINRPDKRNAIDYEVMDRLEEILAEIEECQNSKIVVITGSGSQAFCSGGDLSAFHSLVTQKEAYKMLSRMGKILQKIFLFPKPTVALLNGTAVGGGCEIAVSCDFRVAKKRAKFGFIQGKLGITTGWGGAAMLYERISQSEAMRLLMSAKAVTAEKGKELGFINHTVEPENLKEECLDWLQPFLEQPLSVLKAYKSYWLSKCNENKIIERMDEEIYHCSVLWESDEHHQAVRTFLNKNK
ncbi:enoyl-CoA hydratase/isomerase family protein [Pseudalkalibacillus caeni]|uniref:Ethylmalonyl-CoA decarboxylase n=1 Tax=Exobacillus caeni TaxID=2574798 RepID=A0A5R9F3S0_9BACL|nr:enoyl-CoA hydratase/isomerase family protein [Pseudalkalibacillus caeni]TLS37641.1 enoyl-CoA hydratase/isomerase family protein [Pseudalkalibacillus caeni]